MQQIAIKIAEPCHENWNNMQPAEQGRFCMSCQKKVVDFSVMTDQEIMQHISTASSGICGRAGADQLNRVLQTPPEARPVWWKYWMGLAASVMLFSSRGAAQAKPVKHPVVQRQPKQKQLKPPPVIMGAMVMVKDLRPATTEIRGRIIDDNHQPVPFATVHLLAGDDYASADSSGNFVLTTTANIAALRLSVSSAGYTPQMLDLDEQASTAPVPIGAGRSVLDLGVIQLHIPLMKEVTVVPDPSFLTRTAGGISICRKYTRYEKAKAWVKETTGISELKVYPNPVQTDGQFNISLALNEMGIYQLQFTDAAGRIVAGKQVVVNAKKQTELLNGNMFVTAGVYMVTATNPRNNKVYSTKIFVQ